MGDIRHDMKLAEARAWQDRIDALERELAEVKRERDAARRLNEESVNECNRMREQLDDVGQQLTDSESELELWKGVAEFLDGRLGLPNTREAVATALEEYVKAEDHLPDTFDSETYCLSDAVRSLVKDSAALAESEREVERLRERANEAIAAWSETSDSVGGVPVAEWRDLTMRALARALATEPKPECVCAVEDWCPVHDEPKEET